jgi:hypothetical protein
MFRKIRILVEILLQEGLLASIRGFWVWLRNVISVGGILSAIKLHESKKFKRKVQSQILAGPFSGVKLEKLGWGRRDFISYSAGMYEEELLSFFSRTKGLFVTFIDIGAADGYYAVSSLKKDFFRRVYAFEISKMGRRNIQSNAVINNVAHKIVIRGRFSSDFLENLEEDFIWDSTLILCDIEGAEFELFDLKLLSIVSKAHLLIEVHVKNRSEVEVLNFMDLLADIYHLTAIEPGERNMYKFREYNPISQDLRYLMFSDGRTRGKNSTDLPKGIWVLCCPNDFCKICTKTN